MMFGPESTNPREQRAYVHALASHALATGLPEDKLEAVVAANAASHTAKGKNLGAHTLRALINQVEERTAAWSVPIRHDPGLVWNFVSRSWVGPEFAERYQAVNEALGGPAGVTITHPETEADYLDAGKKVGADPQGIDYARRTDSSLIENDYSVLGTSYRYEAAQALAFDLSDNPWVGRSIS